MVVGVAGRGGTHGIVRPGCELGAAVGMAGCDVAWWGAADLLGREKGERMWLDSEARCLGKNNSLRGRG